MDYTTWMKLTASIALVCFFAFHACRVWDVGAPANKLVKQWVPLLGGLTILIGTPSAIVFVLLWIWS